ncbi:MAG TPA: CDP-diacylglycerol--glycerol-3-phosphate 3-phosphatidyltransferase [Gammaproteobacteria bacterium]|nr:CDP-diacylglycerol--glycerol-3-phosphate 3-phosphatidyltransferase [Gammaproteobacteria bacterium]
MLTIPNLLTFIRIVLIPVLFLVYWLPFPWAKPATAAIFALAAITDWFDGYLARRLNQYSHFGEFLDPVADKLMVASSLILILTNRTWPWPIFWLATPAIIIIGREIVISALREWMAEIGKRAAVAVSMVGKVKTTFQMFAIGFLLYQHPFFGIRIDMLGFLLLQIAAFLTLFSMVLYLKAAWPYITQPPPSLD